MSLRTKRLEILKKVEQGELSVEESNRLLEALEIQDELEVLNPPLVETPPEIPAAVRSFSPETEPAAPVSDFETGRFKHWRWLAMLPFWLSVGFTALSAYWMYQGYTRAGFGWGFFLSWIPFLIGLAGMYIFWGTRWLHVRIRQKAGKKPAVINISIPLPLRAIGWFMRTFGHYMPADLREKHVDEMISSLDEAFTKDTPFHVFVDDEDGEQVEVYIG